MVKDKCWVKKSEASNRVYFENDNGKIASAEKVINTWYAVTGNLRNQKISHSTSKQNALRKVRYFMRKNRC